MQEFLEVRLEEVCGNPPVNLFTVETNIESVQTCLSPGWAEARASTTIPEMLRALELQSQRLAGISALCVSDDGHVAYRIPSCPMCGSTLLKRNGKQARTIRSPFGIKLSLRLQKYQCKRCQHPFKVDLDPIIPKYGHFERSIRDLAMGYTGGNALSLGEAADLVEGVAGVRPSRESIRLWKYRRAHEIEDERSLATEDWSGVYSYDEQYLKVSKKWHYRCLLIDVVLNKVVGEELLEKLEYDAILDFWKRTLEGKPLLTIITDGAKMYPSLVRDIGQASHQKCVVHAMYNTMIDFKEAAGLKPSSKKSLPDSIKHTYGELWKTFLESTSLKDAEDRFITVYQSRLDHPPQVRKRIELLADDFVFLTEYLVHDDVPKTNNAAEGFFRRTFPSRIKKKYRTPQGCRAQIICLDGAKGGWEQEGRTFHERLQSIYTTFARVLVQAL